MTLGGEMGCLWSKNPENQLIRPMTADIHTVGLLHIRGRELLFKDREVSLPVNLTFMPTALMMEVSLIPWSRDDQDDGNARTQ